MRFASGRALSEAIRAVMQGNDVRCAVAFWGAGSSSLVSRPTASRIICDVTMGGTSAQALEELGAPDLDTLRHVPALHAKLYLSSIGAVVGSPNASANGIGFGTDAANVEAGIVLDPTDPCHAEAADWFEDMWDDSHRIGRREVDMARRRFRPTRLARPHEATGGSLLEMVAEEPTRFGDVSFVFAHTRSKPAERRRAVASLVAANPGHEDEIESTPDTGLFTGWSRSELNRWRRVFIELWLENGRLHPSGRRVTFFDDRNGNVLSRAYWPAFAKAVEGPIPSRQHIREHDAAYVGVILEDLGDVLLNADEVAERMGVILQDAGSRRKRGSGNGR